MHTVPVWYPEHLSPALYYPEALSVRVCRKAATLP